MPIPVLKCPNCGSDYSSYAHFTPGGSSLFSMPIRYVCIVCDNVEVQNEPRSKGKALAIPSSLSPVLTKVVEPLSKLGV